MKQLVKHALFFVCAFILLVCFCTWQIADAQNSKILLAKQKLAQEIALQETIDTANYIGNKNSYKLHTLDCSYLPYLENRVYFILRADAIDAGYDPCEKCHP